MPGAQVEERTVGHVARPGYKLNGPVPQGQVGHHAHVAGKSIPKKRVVVNSYISSGVDAGVEGSRAVQTDCNVWKNINGDIDVIDLPVPNDGVIQDLLWLVLHKRCEVEHFGRVLQDTDPADSPVGCVASDPNDVMQHFRSGLVHHGHLSAIGSVSEGEIQHEVLLGRGIEEDERISCIQNDGCTVLDPVRDVDAANLVHFR